MEQRYVHTLELYFCYREYCLQILPKQHTFVHYNGLIFDIMNTQNNQSLEFEWKPMLEPLRSVNNHGFSWLFIMFSLSYSKIGWIPPRKFWNRCWLENDNIVGQQTYERLKISVNSINESTQYLLWHQVKYVLIKRFWKMVW